VVEGAAKVSDVTIRTNAGGGLEVIVDGKKISNVLRCEFIAEPGRKTCTLELLAERVTVEAPADVRLVDVHRLKGGV
jgi:hypothetical protein